MDHDELGRENWIHGKVALLGDAAHAFLPHQVQGGAQAVEDGVAIGALFPLGTQSSEIPQLLNLYVKARYDRATLVQDFSRQSGFQTPRGKHRGKAIDPIQFAYHGRKIHKSFLGILKFAYRGRFWIPETANNIETLWNIYIFAEKKEIEYLQDIMMNRITSFYHKTNTLPSMDTIVYVYENTLAESAIQKPSMARRFLARCYVAISINCLYGAKYEESKERLADVLYNTAGLLSDTLDATRSPAGIKCEIPWKVDFDPRKVKPCDYHQHEWNEQCPDIKETPFNSETDE
ncbi:hypothetical protein DSL72_001751 [Monilinia vaccinii-corymbosi]|uniref:FAD-binding domain-containing protein n=1 Tax=Monilinia vaccinii-corymbosi TaxID=61207 RepID=A0A8A3PAQ5_9HELO|nr:hypothetical protein DSL72_001751 [Monilinia vaccinii-corymbosi]